MSTEPAVKVRKKLIEVALPLEAINTASAREKSIKHGHPSTLHLWWARRPLAAARAVIFAQMVIDPSARPEDFPTEADQDAERERLFALICEMVTWENTSNELLLKRVRDEIRRSWEVTCSDNASHPNASTLFDPSKPPPFHDPFAGGGALPLEAQRLGLESRASDLNPVPVLINKAMLEIPPKFADRAPINPEASESVSLMGARWRGAQGLADDVRFFGEWMCKEAQARIGNLYPQVLVTPQMAEDRPDLLPYVNRSLKVVAWLWARTVKSPNPAFAKVDVPLASSFILSRMRGNEAFVQPIFSESDYRFVVRPGSPPDGFDAKCGTKLARANFKCLMSGMPISGDYIKMEGKAGRMGTRLMAIVAEGDRGRVYLSPTPEHEAVARGAKPGWRPEVAISGSTQYLGVKPYGMERFDQIFSDRQLCALATFADCIADVRAMVREVALRSGMPDGEPLALGGSGASSYADSVSIYLAFVVSGVAARLSTSCVWDAGGATWGTKVNQTFGRQAIPMSWDFAEANPFSGQSGSFMNSLEYTVKGVSLAGPVPGRAEQADATSQEMSESAVISTDPPYYDNIPYADLSDYFYVWLRRSLQSILPSLFATIAVPKAEELVAFAHRHGSKQGAERFFLDGMTQAMQRLADQAHPAFPVTIYYAFKQVESDEVGDTASTGWETFLEAVLRAGLSTTGTWPIRTELSNRMRGKNSNALASSIVLVCRKREPLAPSATRQSFVRQLDQSLLASLRALQLGGVAPVDMAQAAIGPGMAIFTQYSRVLEADGSPMSVRSALVLINEALARLGDPDATETDGDTRWAVSWFEQNGFEPGEFGQAQVLAGAKNIGINGLVDAGIVHSRAGKVRLLKREELHGGDPMSYDPLQDDNMSAWEALQHLVHRHSQGGTEAAGALLRALSGQEDQIKDLAYRLYGICERKKWSQEAMVYNALVADWSDIVSASQGGAREPAGATESGLFGAAPGDDDA